jgi:hypothetical protein
VLYRYCESGGGKMAKTPSRRVATLLHRVGDGKNPKSFPIEQN